MAFRTSCPRIAVRRSRGSACALAVVLAGLGGAARADASACTPPPYFVAVDATERLKGLEDVPGFQYVSVERRVFTVSNLRCLAKTLRDLPVSKIGLSVFIFDQRWAAADFDAGDVMTMSRAIAQSFRYLRARIDIDPKSGKESITLTPMGHKRGAEFESRIDLADEGAPSCRYALSSRCLLAFNAIEPPAAAPAGGRISVTLQATRARSGDISNVRMLSARGGSTLARNQWASAAIKNLRTWWFEPAPRADRLRVTYDVGGPAAAAADGGLQLRFAGDALVTAYAIK